MDDNQRQMAAQIVNVKDWVAKPLDGFAVQKMTEVFGRDEDGRRTKSVGYFKNPTVAAAFAGQQQRGAWSYGTREVHVLTNGTVGFLLETSEPVKLVDDEAAALQIREKALAKLDPKERAVLGL